MSHNHCLKFWGDESSTCIDYTMQYSSLNGFKSNANLLSFRGDSCNCCLYFGNCRTELCRFSGAKIYPGKGIRFVRSDSQVFLFANSKCKRYFHNRLKPSKLTWTAMYRKQHKKDIAAETVKKRRRTTKKPYSRSIVGATIEVIQKKRSEKAEVRDAAREAALREIKERIKKTKDEKKAKKSEVMAKSQKTQSKGNLPKGGTSKGPKLGGGGGKR
ncbi:hypothetical protein Pint_17401 [Pistacia integerrima]|uniref:Uncharacterized protein n=1 Tax=Pistacia integerrima TaxID=434235 RepID=A0ACC0Z053_9ROSI|nr:hypothetical protein Pint_17401 [Pistacia integerrima]